MCQPDSRMRHAAHVAICVQKRKPLTKHAVAARCRAVDLEAVSLSCSVLLACLRRFLYLVLLVLLVLRFTGGPGPTLLQDVESANALLGWPRGPARVFCPTHTLPT